MKRGFDLVKIDFELDLVEFGRFGDLISSLCDIIDIKLSFLPGISFDHFRIRFWSVLILIPYIERQIERKD